MKVLESVTGALAVGASLVYASGVGFYPPGTNVQDISASKFDKVVRKSNYTSIVEFYAPWCGYCQRLAPTYRKLAKSVKNYAINVVSVNCDDNRELCASYQVEGYPTLMVFRPPKHDSSTKSSRKEPVLEVYLQKRDAKSIHKFVVDRIKNYVKRLPGLDTVDYTKWLAQDSADKFVLISKSRAPSPMLKTLAIDFLSSARFGHHPSKTDSVVIDGTEHTLPIFVHYGNNVTNIYDGNLSDRVSISKWISNISGAVPEEGPLAHQKAKKKAKKAKLKKTENAIHDEL